MKTATKITEAQSEAELIIAMQKKAKRQSKVRALLIVFLLVMALVSWVYSVVQKTEAMRMQRLAIQNKEFAIKAAEAEKKLAMELTQVQERLKECRNKK